MEKTERVYYETEKDHVLCTHAVRKRRQKLFCSKVAWAATVQRKGSTNTSHPTPFRAPHLRTSMQCIKCRVRLADNATIIESYETVPVNLAASWSQGGSLESQPASLNSEISTVWRSTYCFL